MREALVLMHGVAAAVLTEGDDRREYRLTYRAGYEGPPVSLALPVRVECYMFDAFPPFGDGLLPEGLQLEALLRAVKLDRDDHFAQLLAVGGDLVGAVTVESLGDGGGA
jgi:serine/threonine-protein kinase HipA